MNNATAKTQTSEIIDWLLGQGRSYADAGYFLEAFAHRLRESNLPVDRGTIGAPVLHPVAQSVFAIWDMESGVRANSVKWDEDGLARLKNSPIYNLYTKGEGLSWDLRPEGAEDLYPLGEELKKDGFTHYLAMPLPFADQTTKAFTVQTKAPEGFSPDDLETLEACRQAIACVLEFYSQRRLASTLMETYVGTRAGQRVLDGNIKRGDGETLSAVIWMSDLRGFTELASRTSPTELLMRLDQYFGLVTDVVSQNQGEVLKFIGDAVLAVFPVGGDKKHAVKCAELAWQSAIDAVAAPDWPDDLRFGVGLHVGDVFYGNIGGESRLDFTVIGSAVNQVSRIEGLCGALDEPVLVSTEFQQFSGKNYRSTGLHQLKGVASPVEVYAPEVGTP
ncbi:MAG: adenylate/guanylate cyclase domain-containing protein [Pseudomonadota bacterium]